MRQADDISILLERLARVLQNDAHAEGLKPTQWEALRFVGRANRFSRTPSGLTTYLGTTKGTVSQTLNALERKGLVRKKGDPGDRRQVRIELTAKGRRLLERDPVDAALQSASDLPERQKAGLERGLAMLLKDTLKRRGGRPFGVCHTCRFFEANHPGGAPHRCALLDATLSDEDSDQICVEQEAAG